MTNTKSFSDGLKEEVNNETSGKMEQVETQDGMKTHIEIPNPNVSEETPNGTHIEPNSLELKSTKPPENGKVSFNQENNAKASNTSRFNRPSVQVGFYTRTAYDLMFSKTREREGRKLKHQMGLKDFDKKVGGVFFSARDDNPIADSVLLEIETLISDASTNIDILIDGIQKQVEHFFRNHNAGLSYNQAYAFTFNANWKFKLSYRLMWLIQKADKYFNIMQIAESADVVSSKAASDQVYHVKRMILNILHFVNRYRYATISRSDIAYMTSSAKQYFEEVQDKLILNSDVLMLNKRAETAPIIDKRPSNNIGDLKEKLQPIYDALRAQELQAIQSPAGRVANGDEF